MNKDVILHTARLARLELVEEEVATFPDQFKGILSFMDQIQDIEVPEGVVRDMQNHNTFREDEYVHEQGESREEILRAFPDREGDYLKVSKVLNN